MARSFTHIQTAHVPEPQAEDREVIQELHNLGRAFQSAVGAYMEDNVSKFPHGTLRGKISQEDKNVMDGLLNAKASVEHAADMTVAEMNDHVTYYGTHLYCLFMKNEENYLGSINVHFNDIADSVDLDISDMAAVSKQLDACERYGFQPIAQLIQRKLDTI